MSNGIAHGKQGGILAWTNKSCDSAQRAIPLSTPGPTYFAVGQVGTMSDLGELSWCLLLAQCRFGL